MKLKETEFKIGKTCRIHPKLKGMRYMGGGCIECVKTRSRSRRLTDPQGYRKRLTRWRAKHPGHSTLRKALERSYNVFLYLWERRRQHAKRDNIKFTILIDDLPKTSHCPILKRKFESTGQWSPSLDRIDNRLGYIPGNVQWLSWRANSLKSDATLEELVLLGEWAQRQLSRGSGKTV